MNSSNTDGKLIFPLILAALLCAFLTCCLVNVFTENEMILDKNIKLKAEITKLKINNDFNKKRIEDLIVRNQDLIFKLSKSNALNIKQNYYLLTISAYTLSKNECNDDLEHTAIMEKPIPGITAAVSRDLMHLLNHTVYIESVGVFEVKDLMNKRYKNSMDLLFKNKNLAIKFGRKQLKVIVID